jgi:quercetin dioxygenase-like cupin family protein
VIRGKITYRFADHDETYTAGDAYYVPPGHTPLLHAGCEIVEFSPTEQVREAVEVIMRNLEGARVVTPGGAR